MKAKAGIFKVARVFVRRDDLYIVGKDGNIKKVAINKL
jgi:hypothetical protein